MEVKIISNLGKSKSINIVKSLTNITSEEIINLINEKFKIYDHVYLFVREFGNLEIDCSKLIANNNSTFTLYYNGGSHNITFINLDPCSLKLGTKWGDYIKIRHVKELWFNTKWLLISDKNAVNL